MVLRTVAAFRDVAAADLACARLEADGIPAVVQHAQHVGLDWLASLALGGAKVQVPEEYVAEAQAALARDRSDDLALTSEARLPPADGDICPACGAEVVLASTLSRRTRAASMLIGLPFVLWRRRWYCQACGHSWQRRRVGS